MGLINKIAAGLAIAGLTASVALADHIGSNYVSKQVILKAGGKQIVSLDCGSGFVPGKGGAYILHADGTPRMWFQPLINQFPLLDGDKDSMVGLAFSVYNPMSTAQNVVVWQTCVTDSNPTGN